MKGECHDGQDRLHFPIGRCEWSDPMQDGAEAVFPAHIGKNKWFFFVYEDQHRCQAIQTAADKNEERRPRQWAGQQSI